VLAVGRYRREPGAVGRARRTAAAAYAAHPWVDGSLVALLVSELATNAVLHSTGPDFYVLCHSPSPLDGSIQVEVHDGGGGPPLLRQPTAADDHGRGLVLLDLLASTWRTEPTSAGKSLVSTLTREACLP
jgi:anti-sigma regulatory factor (Ser/Thr protein kinase)